jgi:hypothetical protein
MDWHAALAFAGGLVQIYSVWPYLKDMFHGTTRANAVSWMLWTLLTYIELFALFSAGASWTVVMVGVSAINLSIITFFALFGYGYKKYGLLDLVCLLGALAAIAGWQITADPAVAIVLCLGATFISSVPTIWKTFKDPHSEHAYAWSLIVIASVLSLGSATVYNLTNLAIPVYNFIESALVAGLAYVGQKSSRSV